MGLVNLLYRLYPALPWFAEYSIAVEMARKYVCRSVLDVGCGKGNLFKVLDSYGLVDKYVGIDKHKMFKVRSPKARFIRHDARKPLPLNERFDCVFFVNSIYYIGLESVGNFRDVGDVFVVIDIDPTKLHIFLATMLENVKRLSLVQLERHITSAGFKVLYKRPGTTYVLVFTP